MTPAEIRAFRQRLNLSQRELGEALGLADPARIVRAWEEGVRNGKPYAPAGTALAAMRYLEAILDVLGLELSPMVRLTLMKPLPDELRSRA